jgi:4-diphosphocytidyl-2-C-methyl-D-erythritol kinase
LKILTSNGTVRVRVPAKINLFLEVTGKRPDGYHELVTVMHPVRLFDDLICRRSKDVRLKGDLEELGEKNLAIKAIRALQKFAATDKGIEIRLKKRIPTGAGMGGGSADAAAAIAAYDRLYGLKLPAAQLSAVAASVGSDVAFFLCSRTALCTGRGELVQPVHLGRPLHFVHVYPGYESSTADVYRRLKLNLTPSRADVNTFLEPLAEGNIRGIGRELFNRLERPAFENLPPLRALKRALSKFGFSGVLMSGSGSSFFGLCASRAEARTKAHQISTFGYGKVFTTSSF